MHHANGVVWEAVSPPPSPPTNGAVAVQHTPRLTPHRTAPGSNAMNSPGACTCRNNGTLSSVTVTSRREFHAVIADGSAHRSALRDVPHPLPLCEASIVSRRYRFKFPAPRPGTVYQTIHAFGFVFALSIASEITAPNPCGVVPSGTIDIAPAWCSTGSDGSTPWRRCLYKRTSGWS